MANRSLFKGGDKISYRGAARERGKLRLKFTWSAPRRHVKSTAYGFSTLLYRVAQQDCIVFRRKCVLDCRPRLLVDIRGHPVLAHLLALKSELKPVVHAGRRGTLEGGP